MKLNTLKSSKFNINLQQQMQYARVKKIVSTLCEHLIKQKSNNALQLPQSNIIKIYYEQAVESSFINQMNLLKENKLKEEANVVNQFNSLLNRPSKQKIDDNYCIHFYALILKVNLMIKNPCGLIAAKLNQCILLKDNISKEEILILIPILRIETNQQSNHFLKLITNILQIVEQSLNHSVSTSYLLAILKMMAQSCYRVSETFAKNINRLIEQNITSFIKSQIIELLSIPHQKSIKLTEMLYYDSQNLILKKFIQALLAQKKGKKQQNNLPERNCRSYLQYKQLNNFFKKHMRNQIYCEYPYIQNITFMGKQIYQSEIFSLYLDSIFYFICFSENKIDNSNTLKIVLKISQCHKNNIIYKLQKIDILKLITVLSQIRFYKLKSVIQNVLYLQLQVLKIFVAGAESQLNLQELNAKELETIFNVLKIKLIFIYKNLKINKQLPYFKIIAQIKKTIFSKNGNKLSFSIHQEMIQFFNFIQILINQKQNLNVSFHEKKLIKQTWYYEILQPREVKQLLMENYSEEQVNTLMNNYYFYKNVFLQPNVLFNYGIVSKSTKRLQFLFDVNKFQKKSTNFKNEPSILTNHFRWKQLYCKNILDCSYQTADSEQMFAKKLQPFLKQSHKL